MSACARPSASTPSVPGRDRHPLVGVGAGLRHARFHLHEGAADAAPALPHLAVGVALRDRRVPRAQEVGAEAEDEPRVRQVERRQLRAAEAQRVGAPQHVVAEQLPDRPARARRTSPGTAARPAPRWPPRARPRNASALLFPLEASMSSRPVSSAIASSHDDRLVLGLAAIARSLQRLRDAIGVIGDLNRRLAARAQAAVVDRDARPRLPASSRRRSARRPACPLRTTSRRRPSRGRSGRSRTRTAGRRSASTSPGRERCPRPARSG